jgi:hypothetical protein
MAPSARVGKRSANDLWRSNLDARLDLPTEVGRHERTQAPSGETFTVVPRLAITTISVPAGMVGTRYSATLPASGGNPPYKWSIISGTLPTGMHLRRSTGALTGKPTVTGTFTFTVQVVDHKTITKPHTQNTATANFSLTIS